jgi:hypothetical protein
MPQSPSLRSGATGTAGDHRQSPGAAVTPEHRHSSLPPPSFRYPILWVRPHSVLHARCTVRSSHVPRPPTSRQLHRWQSLATRATARGERAVTVLPASAPWAGFSHRRDGSARPWAEFQPDTIHHLIIFGFLFSNLKFPENVVSLLKCIEDKIKIRKMPNKFV